MAKICVLTDSTAQFPAPAFLGHELVNIIPLHIKIAEQLYTDGRDIKTSNLPPSSKTANSPRTLPPTVEEFQQIFTHLGARYNEIIAVLLSSHLSPVISVARQAVESARGPAAIHLIDSQTTTVGLGLLTQTAAEAASKGASSTEINRLVRGLLPRVYTVFCVQSLSYLHNSGLLDPAQAIVGELLGITPFFMMENGRLVPIQKVRSPRHLVDILHEFISEFANLKHIALIQGVPPFDQEARNLRERLNGDFPKVSYSEHTMGAALASILGPRSMGVVAMEHCLES